MQFAAPAEKRGRRKNGAGPAVRSTGKPGAGQADGSAENRGPSGWRGRRETGVRQADGDAGKRPGESFAGAKEKAEIHAFQNTL